MCVTGGKVDGLFYACPAPASGHQASVIPVKPFDSLPHLSHGVRDLGQTDAVESECKVFTD